VRSASFSLVTGELFNLVRDHSVLLRASGPCCRLQQHSSVSGSASPQFRRFPRAQLLQRLFECLSRSLDGGARPGCGRWFASGLLIASDIAGALEVLASSTDVRTWT